MDKATAETEIRARLQELSADFWTDAEITRALNEGVKRFSFEERWPWLLTSVTGQSLTAGTATLALQEGVSWARHFSLLVTFAGDSRPRMPRRVSPMEGQRLRLTYYQQQSEPGWYYIYSEADTDDDSQFVSTVRFVPVMNRDATIEYTYYRNPVDVAAGTDDLDMPDEYCEAAIAWATGKLWLKELQFSQKADEQFGVYGKVLDQAKKETRRLTPDSGFAWGRQEPEESGPSSVDEWTRMHIPETLG